MVNPEKAKKSGKMLTQIHILLMVLLTFLKVMTRRNC